MKDDELLSIWKSYDQKIDKVLSVNKELAYSLTQIQLNNTINKIRRPNITMLLVGIIYTIALWGINFVAFKSGAWLVLFGFGVITLIMTIVITLHIYHLVLINQIRNNDNIVKVQENLSRLKISNFNCIRLAILQLPFWSICWVSLDAIKDSPLVYGGVNLLVFMGLSYLAYWLYQELSIENKDSKVNQFFLSGVEWDSIVKSSEILEQLKEYQ